MKVGSKGIIILIAAVMSFKFMSWNSFKLDQVAAIARELGKEPPAMNLDISLQGGLGRRPIQKSFAFNEKGNYYIINQFDIRDYIQHIQDEATVSDNMKITLNGREMAYRFEKVEVNPKLDDKMFEFVVPSKALVMDATDDTIQLLRQASEGTEVKSDTDNGE